MKLFAVTGKPILFSRSPEIFNSIFKQKNIDAKYTRLAADTAKEAVKLFKEFKMSGMSVTAPFKTDIIKYLDKIDQTANEIGSVNTIVNENGSLVGYNTDYYGIINTLKNVKNKKILILGAGGAAKAVAYTIIKNGGLVNIYNRTEQKAKDLASKFNAEYCPKQNLQNAVYNCDIIINTIPTNIKLIEKNWLKQNHIIFDAIYNKSVYQNIANELNIEFYSGKDWLLNQAIPAFNLFFKNEKLTTFNIDIEKNKNKTKIIFTGFMGSGKSHIGKTVSEKINCTFFNTDKIIESKEGISINEIFEKHSETFFRKTENKVLTMLSNMDGKAIVSSGGGGVLDKKNRDLISDNYTSIWLYANPNAIMNRAKPDNRPLLKNNFNIDFITKLMAQRKEFYTKSADIIVDTSNKTSEQVISIIKNELSVIMNTNA